MSVFVGIDGGGSSCRVLALDSVGNVLFQGQSGSANIATTPDARLRRNLATAAEGCPSAESVCGCFAGLVNEELRRKGEDLLGHLFPSAMVRAEPDYAAAFCASPPGTDLCVISGTGSLVCSRRDGQIVKSGGRGFLLGDYGSGFHFGRDALVHYLDHPTKCSAELRDAVEALFCSQDEGTIVAAVYKATTPAGVLAKLARPLGRDALKGEPYALESLTRNFGLLTGVVAAHVERYLPNSRVLSVSLSGGVWRVAPIFVSRFEQSLKANFPSKEVIVKRILQPPIYGAVVLARDHLNDRGG